MAFGLSSAQNIFKDNFSSYTVNSPLNNQGGWTNNSQTFGLGACLGNPCGDATVKLNSLSYLGYGSTNKSIEINGFSDNPGKAILPTINNGTFYSAFVLNSTNAPQTDVALDLIRVANGTSLNISFRLLVQQSNLGFKFGIKKGLVNSPLTLTSNTYNLEENILVIMKYTIVPGLNNNVYSLYVNPNYAAGEPITPTISTTSGNDADTNIDRIAFKLGQNESILNGNIGLVSVARTWADLGFGSLGNINFNNSTFKINKSQANQGIININSSIVLEKASLNIYDIQGRFLENKTISLIENSNEISINPISNSGIYIVEIITGDGKITQKIAIK